MTDSTQRSPDGAGLCNPRFAGTVIVVMSKARHKARHGLVCVICSRSSLEVVSDFSEVACCTYDRSQPHCIFRFTTFGVPFVLSLGVSTYDEQQDQPAQSNYYLFRVSLGKEQKLPFCAGPINSILALTIAYSWVFARSIPFRQSCTL